MVEKQEVRGRLPVSADADPVTALAPPSGVEPASGLEQSRSSHGARFILEVGKLAEHYAIPMILHCPICTERHIDEAEFAEVAHHTHACQSCGFVWRPAKVNTHGVRFLPGYQNA